MKAALTWIFLITAFIQMVPTLGWASGFTIERSQMIFPFDPDAADGSKLDGIKIYSFYPSQKNSFLLAGDTDKSHSLFLKISLPENAGLPAKLDWQKVIAQNWPVYSATYSFNSSDGGYWGIGYAYSKDVQQEIKAAHKPFAWLDIVRNVEYNYLIKLDHQGNPLQQKPLVTDEYHDVTCGIDVKDGLVFIGRATATYEKPSIAGTMSIDVPWIEKTDKEGKMLWQKAFSQNNDEALQLKFTSKDQINCKGLSVSPSGNIVWATVLNPIKLEYQTDKYIIPQDSPHSKSYFETIIFELDQAGNEIHRMESMNADNASIFSSVSGFSLVEHFQPYVPASVKELSPPLAVGQILSAQSKDGGIRLTNLNANLQILKVNEYKLPALNNIMGDILFKENGEVFVAGCNNDGVQAIVYLNSVTNKVDVSKIYPYKAANQCATFGWAEYPHSDALLLYAGNNLDGFRLMTIKYNQ